MTTVGRNTAGTPDALRAHLARVLEWDEAHAGFDKAVSGLAPAKRGLRAPGFEHSPWELLEHMRLAQKDLLDFCVNPGYAHALAWPDDYWPRDSAPPGETAWDESVAAFTQDRESLKAVVLDTGVDLFAPVPSGKSRHTYLRAILLAIDHQGYHVGQLVALRRALGEWNG